MESILEHKSGLLFVVGAAFTSWRIARFGEATTDRAVLRFLCGFFSMLGAFWLVSPFSSAVAIAASVMFSLAIVLLFVGGIPGLRISIPSESRERFIKEQTAVWFILIVSVIVWQKLQP